MKINVIQNKLTAVMISALLAGCSLTPEYKRPDAPVAKSWSKAEETRSSAGSPESIMNWQSLVRDPDLRALIALSLQENRNLRQTLLNADAMRAQYQIQRADRLPELQIQGNETRQRTLRI